VDLRNRLVNFRICDIYHPDPRDLLKAIYGENILQGQVCDLTTGGADGEAYLVVRVEGLSEPTIIPRRAVLGVL
jgi:hypothetical protein